MKIKIEKKKQELELSARDERIGDAKLKPDKV
jgi:hypothetical protein